MVHFVKKGAYLYLQKSFHIKGTKKKRTEHVAYLGRADRYTGKQLKGILSVANTSYQELRALLKKYKEPKKRKVKSRVKELPTPG